MIEIIDQILVTAEHSRPTAAELAAALQRTEVADAAAILASSWVEVENHCARLWGVREVSFTARILQGTAIRIDSHRPIPEALTSLERWESGAWAADDGYDYDPSGVISNLAEGTVYRVTYSAGYPAPAPGPVTEGVLRLAAWRVSYRGRGIHRFGLLIAATGIVRSRGHAALRSV